MKQPRAPESTVTEPSRSAAPPLVDARGIACALDQPPQRIVSLVPSTTETLHALGCADRVVGVTRFCCHPGEWTRTIPNIGGTKDVEIDRVRALQPDLVIGNCEENTAEIFDALAPHVPVWAAFPKTVADAIDDLRHVSTLVHAQERGEALATGIETQARQLQALATQRGPFTYAYLIWRAPWMTINQDTFIADMLATAGGTNVFGTHPERFPTVTLEDLGAARPDITLLSSEPFSFRERHRDELVTATGCAPEQVRFIDGEYASWHGARTAEGLAYLSRCLTAGWPTSSKSS